MKKDFLVIAFLFIWLFSFGQQITQYSQWSYNQFSINPALAGVKKCLDIRSAGRIQWAGFEGAPKSGLITINAPLTRKTKGLKEFFHGIGAKFEGDALGPFNNFSLSMAYALHFPIGMSGQHRMSLGLSAGVQQFGFDQTKIITIDSDPAVARSANLFLAPLISFGGFYYSEHFYVGMAMDQLARNEWEGIGYTSRFRLHTKLQTGAKITFENDNSILPGILFRFPPAGVPSLDINVMFDVRDQYMLGIGYRNTDAFIAYFKLNHKQLSFGYSFDFITSSIRKGTFHTHEISIQYNGCYQKKRPENACPLFE